MATVSCHMLPTRIAPLKTCLLYHDFVNGYSIKKQNNSPA